jgi:putative ABC transport system permease protein
MNEDAGDALDFGTRTTVMNGLRHLIQDLGYAFRTMRRNPLATATAMVVLAVGIGPNAAMFSVVNRVLLEPLPYPSPDRLLQIIVASPMGNATLTSAPKYITWRVDRGAFEHIAAFGSAEPILLSTDGPAEVALAMRVSAGYFPVFGIAPGLGRTFSDEDDVPRGPQLAVISEAFWQRRFGRDRAVVGRLIRVDGRPHEVIGVIAAGAPADPRADVWLPLQADPLSRDHSSWLQVVARLRPGVTADMARRQIYAAAGEFHKRFPTVMGPREHFGVMWLRDVVVGDARPALLFLLGAVMLVLLVACGNVANLLLAQGTAREREFSVRAALGASPGRIVRQLLTESVLLTLSGAAIGVMSGLAGVRWLLAVKPGYAWMSGPSKQPLTLDWNVMGFMAVLLVVTTGLFGLYPAIRAARLDLTSTIGSGAGQITGARQGRLRPALVVAQLACALVLLVGAGLFIQAFVKTRTVDPGFASANILTLEMPLSGPRFARTAAVAQLIDVAEHRIAALPDVAFVAATSSLPLEPSATLPFAIDRRPLLSAPFHGTANWRRVSRAYFEVFRIRLLRGRTFTQHDTLAALPVAVINESMARKFWPGSNPLDERLTAAGGIRPDIHEPSRVIVGIVADVRDTGLGRNPEPVVYVPIAQVSDGMNEFQNQALPLQWAVRTNAEPRRLAAAIERELQASSKSLPLGRVRTMDEIVALSTTRADFNTTVLAIFAFIALALASVGLYGLMVYSIQQRTREFGVRLALGAEPWTVRWMVLREGARLVVAGLALGTASAWLLARTMAGTIHGVDRGEPLIVAGVAVVLSGVAFVAITLSARRVSSVEPTEALRHV